MIWVIAGLSIVLLFSLLLNVGFVMLIKDAMDGFADAEIDIDESDMPPPEEAVSKYNEDAVKFMYPSYVVDALQNKAFWIAERGLFSVDITDGEVIQFWQGTLVDTFSMSPLEMQRTADIINTIKEDYGEDWNSGYDEV